MSDWIQRGYDIDGGNIDDYSGNSISLNANGNILVVGSKGNDYNGTNSGKVSVYVWDGFGWNQRGYDIYGEAIGDESGISVSSDSSGNTIAIGAMLSDDNGPESGHVRVYMWDGFNWTQKGSDIIGENSDDYSGISIDLNAAGNVLAIGSPFNDDNGLNSGSVRVYAWNGFSWIQRGTDIDGENTDDRSGCSVSLNSTGNILAIGANLNDGNGSNSGHVRVYYWDGSSWTQRGNDINGEASNDESGFSVALNSSGDILAIGAINNNDNGHVRVYFWNGSSWTQRGNDIDDELGDEPISTGWSVSLNSAGDIIAIGSPYSHVNELSSGHVKVYFWDGSNWTQKGSTIYGEGTDEDQSGFSVSLNSTGDIVAIGAPGNDSNGTNSGHVRVFYFQTTTTTTTTTTGNPACSIIDLPYVPITTTLPPNAICPCGTVFLPKGSKHNQIGLSLRIYHDSSYSDFDLVHNEDIYLSNEEVFVTTTKSINESISGQIKKIAIFCDKSYNINIINQIRIIFKLFDTKEIIAIKNIGVLNTKTAFAKNIIDDKSAIIIEDDCLSSLNTNLQGKKIQLEFYSICDIYDENCCDEIIPNMILVNRIGYLSIPCCSSTTTTTTTTSTTTTTTSSTTYNPNRNRGLVGWDYGSGRCASFSNVMGIQDLQNPNYNLLVRNISKWLVKEKTNPKIIVLTTQNQQSDTLILSCLNNISNNVTILNKTFYNYDGTGLNDADLLIMTASYNWASGATDISPTVQNQMLNFVNNGGAILTSEWLMWHSKARNRLQILKAVFPVEPTSSWSTITALQYFKQNNNPIITNNLPDSWVWTPASAQGTETIFSLVKPNAIVFYDSDPSPSLFPIITSQPASQSCAFNQNNCLVSFSVDIQLRANNMNGELIPSPYPSIIYTWQKSQISSSGPWIDTKITNKSSLSDTISLNLPINTWVRCVINTGTHIINTIPAKVNSGVIV